MSFYSYKNANASCCPGMISGDATNGLQEKVCVQVKRVYDSALWQQQIDNAVVTCEASVLDADLIAAVEKKGFKATMA